jgi:hypothetical protein
MSSPYPRDLIGYGGAPPHPGWPGDTRIAINFVMNYEEGTRHAGVWVTRRIDIARHWIATHPPRGGA